MTTPYIKKPNYHLKEVAAPFVGQRLLYGSTVFYKKIYRSVSFAWSGAFLGGSAGYAWGNNIIPGYREVAIKGRTWCEYVAEYP